MKKHLIAAAVAAAVAAPVMAQVTVYGTIDASYASIETTSTAITQSSGDYLGSSILGFKGSEDLGGGLKAEFALEGDLNVNNGAGDGTGGGLTFDRQSWVGVSGSFGTVKIGRTSDATDSIKGLHGMGANLFDSSDAGPFAGGKMANQIRFDSPNFSGVTVVATTSIDNNAVGLTAAGTTNTGQTSSFGVTYTAGPLMVAAARAQESVLLDDDVTQVITASYDFGMFAVNFRNQTDEGGTTSYKANALGVSVPLGQGLRGVFHLQRQDRGGAGTADFSSMGGMLIKDFSKRTSAYVGIKSLDSETASSDTDTTVIGLQHKF